MLIWFALTSLVGGCLLRIVHRGPYFPGWDVIGAASGVSLLWNSSSAAVLQHYLRHHFEGVVAWNVFGAPVALLPGALTLLWPSEYWAHATTIAIVAVTLGLLGRAVGAWSGLLLAWSSSPALVSYTVAGFPYVSNALPYSLALWIVLRWQRSLPATLVLSLLACELAWHVQELGRTVFVVFFAGALLLRGMPWPTRAVWAVVGAVQLALAVRYPSFNTQHYANMTIPSLASLPPHAAALLTHLLLGRADVPFLMIAGFLAAIVSERRWFWLSLLGFHLGLLLVLASNVGTLQGVEAVWPRRVLLLNVLSAAVVASVWARRSVLARVATACVVLGAATQLVSALHWAVTPLDTTGRGWAWALPYTHTPRPRGHPMVNLDGMVPLALVDAYLELRDHADRGGAVLLIYNLTSFDENAGNPFALPERLLLHLGPERFREQIYVFGDDRERWYRSPFVRAMSEIKPSLRALVMKGADVRGLLVDHPRDGDWAGTVKHRREMAVIQRHVQSFFQLLWDPERRDGERRIIRLFSAQPIA